MGKIVCATRRTRQAVIRANDLYPTRAVRLAPSRRYRKKKVSRSTREVCSAAFEKAGGVRARVWLLVILLKDKIAAPRFRKRYLLPHGEILT